MALMCNPAALFPRPGPTRKLVLRAAVRQYAHLGGGRQERDRRRAARRRSAAVSLARARPGAPGQDARPGGPDPATGEGETPARARPRRSAAARDRTGDPAPRTGPGPPGAQTLVHSWRRCRSPPGRCAWASLTPARPRRARERASQRATERRASAGRPGPRAAGRPGAGDCGPRWAGCARSGTWARRPPGALDEATGRDRTPGDPARERPAAGEGRGKGRSKCRASGRPGSAGPVTVCGRPGRFGGPAPGAGPARRR